MPQPKMMDLIHLRARLRREVQRLQKEANQKHKASFADEDSDSYFQSHDLYGQLNGAMGAYCEVCDLITEIRERQ